MKSIVEHSARQAFALPGLEHRTTAGRADGLSSLEVWVQTVDAGAETPVHSHDCDEAVVILEGSGRLIADGETAHFAADQTLCVPAGVVHQIINDGTGPIRLIGALSATPPGTFAADGSPMELPWDQK